jgi:uncharacterized protein YecT (DUF1311 family)
MVKLSLVLTTLAVLAWPASSLAQSAAFQAFAAANQELRAVIASYRTRLSEPQKLVFDQAHKLWVEYRQAACEFHGSGSVDLDSHSTVVVSCLEFITRSQLEYMKYLASCEDTDPRCPVRKGDI